MRASRRLLVVTAFGMVASSAARGALADDPPYSPYERQSIAQAARELKATVDPEPEGKIVESIELRPLDVFEPRDPLPDVIEDFLNVFHARTRPFIIEREVLLDVGKPWEQRLADETARNLRDIRQLSLVLVVPLKGSSPDKVKVLVITKDIWSLRLNSDFRVGNGQLEYLVIAPSEENLAGLHHSGSVRFIYEPDTYTFGLSYKVPRIGTSWIQASASTNVIINQHTGDFEGTSGSFGYGQPLYSTETEWSWVGGIVWLSEVTRFFRGTEELTFDAEVTPDVDDAVPYEYDTEEIAARFAVTRSFGSVIKHDVGFGAEASRAVYRMRNKNRFSAAVVDEFESTILPVSDKRVYPFLGYASYSTTFKSFVDFNTLGLQEDYRLGHDLYLKAYPVLEELASSRSYAGGAAGASYSVAMGDGLARGYAQGVVEAAPERVYDANLLAGARIVTPRMGFGRLVVDGYTRQRFENFLNRRSTIGGDTRLRGYPSGAYRGENIIAYNLELRSSPFEILTVQVGGVAFFDAGVAYDSGDPIELRQSAGVGARVVFPQLDRSVLRFDWGLPTELDPEVGVTSIFPGHFTFTFKQAFEMPSIAPPTVLD